MSKKEIIATLRECHKKMLLSKEETANELSISRASLDRLRESGMIDAKIVGGKVTYSIAEIARYLSL